MEKTLNNAWVKGTLISFLITIVSIIVFAILLTYTDIKESSIFPTVVFIISYSILIGSSISTINVSKNGIVNGGAIGLIYILLIYLLSSFMGAGFLLSLKSFIIILCAICAGMIGGIVGINLKK